MLAFIKGWLLTLVMLSTIPPFVAAGGIVAKMLSKISSEGLESYSDAGDIVEQTIGSIRTVGLCYLDHTQQIIKFVTDL